MRRIFSLLVEKSGAERENGFAEREREICGAFSPSCCRKAADHAFLHIAVKNRVFLRFPACECVCGDMRRIPFLLRILRAAKGAEGFLRAFLFFRLALPADGALRV